MICKQNNKILEKGIKKIVQNVKTKYYGKNYLEPSGPLLLKFFFSSDEINNFNIKFNEDSIFYNDKKILTTYTEYRNEQKKYGTPHYSKLWNEKNIYKK